MSTAVEKVAAPPVPSVELARVSASDPAREACMAAASPQSPAPAPQADEKPPPLPKRKPGEFYPPRPASGGDRR